MAKFEDRLKAFRSGTKQTETSGGAVAEKKTDTSAFGSFAERLKKFRSEPTEKSSLQGTMGTRGVPAFNDIYKYIVQETRKGNWDTAQNTERKYWERMTDAERQKLNDYYKTTYGLVSAGAGESALTSQNVAKLPNATQKAKEKETEKNAEWEEKKQDAKDKMNPLNYIKGLLLPDGKDGNMTLPGVMSTVGLITNPAVTIGALGFGAASNARKGAAELKTMEEMEANADDHSTDYGGQEGYELKQTADKAALDYEDSYQTVQVSAMQLRETEGQLETAKNEYVEAEQTYLNNPTQVNYNAYKNALDKYNGLVTAYDTQAAKYNTDYADYKAKVDAAGVAATAYNDHITQWEMDLDKSVEEAQKKVDAARADVQAYGQLGYDSSNHSFTYASSDEALEALEVWEKELATLKGWQISRNQEEAAEELRKMPQTVKKDPEYEKFLQEGRVAQETYDTAARELDYYLTGAPTGYTFRYGSIEEAQAALELVQKIYGEMTAAPVTERNAFATDAEWNTYLYKLGKKDGSAMEYYKAIRETLTNRAGTARAKAIEEKQGVARLAAKVWTAANEGAQSVLLNTAQHFKKEAIPTSVLQASTEEIIRNSQGAERYAVMTAQQVGSMLPQLLAASTGIGMPVAVGVSASGGAVRQALREGYSQLQARAYGVLVGVSEAVLEKLLGGVGGHLGIGPEALARRISGISSGIVRFGLNLGVDMAGEITEEEFQNFLEPALANIALGKKYEAPTAQMLLETAIVTAASTLIFSTGDAASRSKYDRNTNRLVRMGLMQEKSGEAHRLAETMQQKLKAGEEISPAEMKTLYQVTMGELNAKAGVTARQEPETKKAASGETTEKAEKSKGGETAHVIQKLQENMQGLSSDTPVATISSADLNKIEGRTMAERGKVLFERIKGIVTRKGFGDVEINDRSSKDDLSHGIGYAKAAVIPAIPYVIQNGTQIDFQTNWKNRAYDGYIFAAPVVMDGETVYVAAVVKKTSKNRFYLHEVVDSNGNIIKINNGERTNQTSLAAEGDAGAQSPLPNPIISGSEQNNNPQNIEGVNDNGTEGNGISDGSGKRDDGTSAGEQVRSVDRGTGKAKSTALEQIARAGERRNRAKGLRKVSAKSLGVSIGTEQETVTVLPEEAYDEELRKVSEKVEKETGKKPIFVLGGMKIQGKEKIRTAKGVILADGTVIIQADHSKYTAQQIADHELFHHKSSLNLLSVPDAIRRIREKFTKEEFGKVIQKYLDAYAGIIDIPQNADAETVEAAWNKLYEEILADAHAGINAFGAEKFSEVVNEYMAEQEAAGTEQTAAATERSTGPPRGESFSLAGENAETANREKLAKAKEMEETGATREDIWQETGWGRGDDGKWRFEIDDSKMQYRRGGDARFRQDHPGYVRHQELTEKMLTGDLTEAEQAELRELDEIWGREYGRLSERVAAGNATLENLIEHEALFEAYPELRDTKVVFGELDGSAKGEYNRQTNTITIRNDLRDAPEDTILHEIQHAVQNMEGFAGGSSVVYWAAKDHETGEVTRVTRNRYDEIYKGLTREEQNKYIRYKELERELERLEMTETATSDDERYARYEAESDKLYAELYATSWFAELDALAQKLENPSKMYREAYRNSAGENEARDAASRRKLTADERKNTPPKLLGEDAVFAEESGTSTMAVDKYYKKVMKKWDGVDRGGYFKMGTVSEILQKIGFPPQTLLMDESKAEAALLAHKEITPEVLSQIPDMLENPIAISHHGGNNINVFGHLYDDQGRPIMVGVRMNCNARGPRIDAVSKVRTVELRTHDFKNKINDDNVLYLNPNKNETTQWFQTVGESIPLGGTKFGLIHSISDFITKNNHQNAESQNFDDTFSVDVDENVDVDEDAVATALEDTESTETTVVGEKAKLQQEIQRLQDPAYIQQRYVEGGFAAVKKAETEVKKLQARLDKLNGVQKPQKPKKEVKPVAESKPIIAKKDLKKTVLDMFSIPEGQKKKLGDIIDRYAERLLRDGRLTEEDRKAFFDRLYENGVMAAEADEYLQAGREAVLGSRIYVNDSIKAEFGEDWNSFRQRAFAAGVYLVNDSKHLGVDSAHMELAGILPGLFDANEYDGRTMLERIVDVAEEGKEELVSLSEYAAILAGQHIITEDEFLDNMERKLDAALKTFSEKAELEVYLRDRTGKVVAENAEKFAERYKKQAERNERHEAESREWFKQKAKKERERYDAKLDEANKENIERLQRQKERFEIHEMRERQLRREMVQQQREAKLLKEEQQRTLKNLQWLKKNWRKIKPEDLEAGKLPPELQKTWEEVLSDIDLYCTVLANQTRYSKKYDAAWQEIHDMYKTARKTDPNFLPSKDLDRIMDRVSKEKLSELDPETLQNLLNAVLAVRHAYSERNKVLGDMEHELFSEAFQDTKTVFGKLKRLTPEQIAKEKGFFTKQLSAENKLLKICGGDTNSSFWKMVQQMAQGERKMNWYRSEAYGRIQKFMDTHKKWLEGADGQGKKGRWIEVEIPECLSLEVGKLPEFGKTHKIYMTELQRVQLYLESKGEDNLRHMLGGRTFCNRSLYQRGITEDAWSRDTIYTGGDNSNANRAVTIRLAPETVKAIVKDMTAEEMELAKLLEDYYNTFAKEEINKVSQVLYGFDKAMGRYYAPIRTNTIFTKSEPGVYDETAAGAGHMKERITGSKNPSLNLSALDSFMRHVDDTSRFVGMAIPARNWNSFTNRQTISGGERSSTMGEIEKVWGKGASRQISDLLVELQGGSKELRTGMKGFTDWAYKQHVKAIFAGNIGSVLKQFGSYFMGSGVLDLKTMPKTIIKKYDRGLIDRYSHTLKMRETGDYRKEVRTLISADDWTQKNAVTKFIFGGAMTKADTLTAGLLWSWAENQVTQDHPELQKGSKEQIENGESPFYQKVAEVFDEAVELSQSGDTTMRSSELRKSDSAIDRTLTMFKPDAAKGYNLLARNILIKRHLKESGGSKDEIRAVNVKIGQTVLGMLMNNVWAAAVTLGVSALKGRMRDYEDEEGKVTAKSATMGFLEDIAQGLAGTVAGAEELLEVVGNSITGERWYGIDTPGLSQVEELIEDAGAGLKGITETLLSAGKVAADGGDLGEYWRRHWQNLVGDMTAVGKVAAKYAAGIPVDNVVSYLFRPMKHLLPGITTEMEDWFTQPVKSELEGLKGNALQTRVGNIFDNRAGAGKVDDKVISLVSDLYEQGYAGAVPSETSTSFTIDGEKVELTEAQRQEMDRVWQKYVPATLNGLMKSKRFGKLPAETQGKVLKKLYSFALELGKEEVVDGFAADNWVQEMKGAREPAEWLVENVAVGGKYGEFLEAGVQEETAFRAAKAIEGLKPAKGKEDVAELQKCRAAVDATDSYTEQMKLLSVIIHENTYKKLKAAQDYYVTPVTYVAVKEQLPKFDADGNGRYKNDEVRMCLNSIPHLSTEARAALWQMLTGSTSEKNNPYSKTVGRKILNATK